MRAPSLLLVLLLAGCGSSGGGNSFAGPVPETTVPTAVGLPADPGTGRAYVITSSGGLELFSHLNPPTRGVQADLRLTLPRSNPLTIAHDAVTDRLYIGCADGSLLIYDNASKLTNASTPGAILAFPGNTLQSSALDQPHDILFLGASNGRMARLTGISQANNSTRATFVNVTTANPPVPPAPSPTPGGSPTPAPPPPPTPTLNILLGLASNPGPDVLYAAGAATPGNVRTLSTYSSASTAFSFAGLISPGGLRNAQGVALGDANRLYVLDQDAVKRYEPTNNYAGNATLTVEAPFSAAFAYDARQDVLYVGGDSVLAYANASRLTGNVTAAGASGELVLQTGAAEGIAVDATR